MSAPPSSRAPSPAAKEVRDARPDRGRVAADVLVLGGGMAGTIAALAAREAGATVALVRRGPGATALSSGAIGVAPAYGATRLDPLAARRGPIESARRIAASRRDHPYARLGPALEELETALEFAAKRVRVLAPFTGASRWIATPYGAAVECALCQTTMAPGDLATAHGPIAVVGLRGHLGWDPRLVAHGIAGLAPAGAPDAAAVELDFFRGEHDAVSRPHDLAAALEGEGVAERAGARLREVLPRGAAVALFPPILGLDGADAVVARLSAAAGVTVAEMLGDVPSVPGARLDLSLRHALSAAGVTLVDGTVDEGSAPGAPILVGGREVDARAWVLASGRFIGGGIARRGGNLEEPLLGLPVEATEGGASGFHLAQRPAAMLTVRERGAAQPLLAAGLRVDGTLRPLDGGGRPVHDALFAAGAVIGGHEHAADGTGLGVAVLTGWIAGRAAAGRTA